MSAKILLQSRQVSRNYPHIKKKSAELNVSLCSKENASGLEKAADTKSFSHTGLRTKLQNVTVVAASTDHAFICYTLILVSYYSY